MKKILIGAVLAGLAVSAVAQHRPYRPPMESYRDRGYHHHVQRGDNGAWIAPLIIGGIVGAVIARESQQPQVVVQQPPVVVAPPVNAVIIDGQIYTKQVIYVDGVYREVLIRQ